MRTRPKTRNAARAGQARRGKQVEWTLWSGSGSGDKMVVFDTADGGAIRMSAEEATVAALKTRLMGDKSFSEQRDHCTQYVWAFHSGPDFVQSEYDALGDKGCAEYAAKELTRR